MIFLLLLRSLFPIVVVPPEILVMVTITPFASADPLLYNKIGK